MNTWKRFVPFVVGIVLITMAASPIPRRAGENPNPPEAPVKLIFIHHSTGENWLTDGYGNLGQTLSQNNYFVSDTNYGWGPNSVGDRTDIPNWTEWFAGGSTSTYMNALFNENGQHSTYTRTLSDPGGQNEIIMFKSCFPNSALAGNPNDPPNPEGDLTVGHAKYVYNEILQYFATRPDKMFVVITAPPLQDGTYAANARAFNQWLMNDWLDNYNLNNVYVFDFYNVLTGPNAHHRYNNGQIEYVLGSQNTLYYPSGDDHPSVAGSQKATSEFVSLLNIFYHRWKASTVGGCSLFPANNIWNTPVNNLPVETSSDQWVNSIGRGTGFHMDFGTEWDGGPIGIPYNIVGSDVPKVAVAFTYAGESDPGPYPIPTTPLIEYGSDHHILIVDKGTCTLYELFDASYSGGQWHAGSGAIWNLNSNALRPDEWTSADAAGLPILPGLVRYDEVASGEINHAIRFTAEETAGKIWPARHLTSEAQAGIPPMGARFRLKADYDISGYPPALQVILRAMKTYGIILADNGSNWYISGAPDARWDDDMLHLLDDLTGDDFEAVNTSGLMVDYNSGAASSQPEPVPTVTSVARAGANPTSAVSVNFTVTFSEPVIGIETTAPFNDFTLTTTGVSGAAITSISGSDATRIVTVNTGSGNGTIRLDVPGTATITDVDGNSLGNLPFTGGQVYAIERAPVIGTGMYDDVDAALKYSGSWSTWSGTGPYSRTMHYTNAAGAAMTFQFQAPAKFILFFQKYSNRSNIMVSVDGGTAVPVSAYSATNLWQQSYTSALYSDTGTHTVTISTPGDGKYIDIDAVQIAGPPTAQGVGMYDDAHAGWTYNGSWSTWSGTGPYANTMHYTNASGAVASFQFRAPAKFILFFQKASNRSNIMVSVDGGTAVPVSAYSSSSQWQQTYTSAMYSDTGTHTVTLSTPGDGRYIDIDAIQIVGPPTPQGAGMYDDSHAAWTYSGSWATWSGTGPYANTMRYTNATGATASFQFQAPAKFILFFQKASNRSNIMISVDGGTAVPVSAYSSSSQWQQTYTSAMYSDTGAHTVTLSTPGDGKYIDIDAIQIIAPPTPQGVGMYDDSSAGWTYSGSWATWSGSGPYANSMHYTNVSGATATFTFQAPAKFTLYFQKTSNRSNIMISVDGGAAVPINAYSLTNLWQQTYTSALYSGTGAHTVTISTPGDGKYIDIDAIQISP